MHEMLETTCTCVVVLIFCVEENVHRKLKEGMKNLRVLCFFFLSIETSTENLQQPLMLG